MAERKFTPESSCPFKDLCSDTGECISGGNLSSAYVAYAMEQLPGDTGYLNDVLARNTTCQSNEAKESRRAVAGIIAN